jgi:hypothetical protein
VRNLLTLFVFGIIAFPVGCATADDPFRKITVPEAGPTGLDEAQFEDVPVPRGFTLQTRRSFSYRSADLRMGQFVYHGTLLSPAKALSWLEQEMERPMYGWTVVEQHLDEGWTLFRKGSEEARVRTETAGNLTRVTIDVNYREDAPRTES